MITKKSKEEIKIMAQVGRALASIMSELEALVAPGISTKELDTIAHKLILSKGGKPSFLGYNDFPAVLCVSLNEEIVHGVPSNQRILKQGDIVSLDIGMFHNGFHTDMARTFSVGNVSQDALDLIDATQKALQKGIEASRVGNTFADISAAVQDFAKTKGFSVVKELCGHGIGRELHEEPQILNYAFKGQPKIEIEEGMVFCIEPMLTKGDWCIKEEKESHAFSTADRSLSAHFEDTIAATKDGPLVLTKP